MSEILLKNPKNHKLRVSAVAVLVSLGPMTVRADQVVNDDLIVVGNACIGADCLEDRVFDTSDQPHQIGPVLYSDPVSRIGS